MKETTPGWFIFDIGNVLLTLDYDKVLRNIGAAARMPADELKALLESEGGYRDLERGMFDFADFHRFLSKKAGYTADVETLRGVWSDFFQGRVDGIEEVLRRVRMEYRVAFLSNSNEVHAKSIPRDFPDLFVEGDLFVFSHEHRSAKPDALIFTKALEILAAEPADCIYVDDLAENVATAAGLGFIAFQFTGSDEMLRRLEREKLLQPPS